MLRHFRFFSEVGVVVMKQIKMILMVWAGVLVCLLMLTGCQPAPSQSPVSSMSQSKPGNLENSDKETAQSSSLELVHSVDGSVIKETLAAAENKKIILNATVSTKKVENLQQYQYNLVSVTDQLRKALFSAYFGDRTSKAVYDEKNKVWELRNSEAVGDEYLYQVTIPRMGETIPGEEIFTLAYSEVNLYPFDDNLLRSVSECGASISFEDAISLCDKITEAIVPKNAYTADVVLPYGNQGRRPYYKIIYRRTVDGIPVTGYNDLYFLVDSSGIQTISGATYGLTPKPLSSKILSLDDALAVLRDNVNVVNFYGKNTLNIGAITMEYMVTLTETQEVVVTPVWRFQIGSDKDSLGINRRYVLAVDAVTGNLIQGERGMNF